MRVNYLTNHNGNKASNCFAISMDNGDLCLFSYATHVATYRDGEMLRHWAGKSNTTMKHFKYFIDEFCYGVRAYMRENNIATAGKYWDALNVVSYH